MSHQDSEHLESNGKDYSTQQPGQSEEHDKDPQSDHIESEKNGDPSPSHASEQKEDVQEDSSPSAAPPIEQANPLLNGIHHDKLDKEAEADSEQALRSYEDEHQIDSADNQPKEDKGKGKQTEENVDSNLEQSKSDDEVEQIRSEAPTPEPPAHVRYMLPIGGPGKKRPGIKGATSSSSTPSLGSAIAGPSRSKPASSVIISEPSSHDNALRRSTSNASNASTIKTHSRNKSNISNTSAGKKTTKRRLPKRRMSSSDIPERKPDQMHDEVFVAFVQGRRRSNTVAVRGEKARNTKTGSNRERPKTAPALPNGAVKSLSSRNRSTLMIDGQMFTLDDDLKKYSPSARSLRARSDTLGTTTTTQDSHATSHDGMVLLEGGMRNPVAAQTEPMIYDADELDDVPPPGSYAIHPPSQRRLAEAAELSLYSENGELVRFGRLFEKQRTLVIFLRHWFCPFCQMFAQSIQKVDPLPLQRANLGMIVVGQGHWHVTKSYKEVMKIPQFVQVFSDPTRKIYTALGMTLRTNDAGPACSRPDYQTMGAFKASMVAIKKGVVDMPIRLPGDVKLLGGEFILGPDLQCSFTHRMVTTRGHLDLPRILVQAGCDLSLRTPKDVLAERDTGPRKPGSTRSADRINARRIAKRLARRNRKPITPKDTLMMKSKQAAEEAASGEGSTQRTQSGNRSMPPSLSKRFLRPSTGDTGQTMLEGQGISTVSTDEFVHIDSKGIAHSIQGGDASKDLEAEWDEDLPQNEKFSDRTRRKLIDGLQTGFSVTAGATVLAAGKAKQAASTVASDINSSRLLRSTSFSKTKGGAPPLPRTSSADAYEAANLRQRLMNSEQDTNLELNGLSYAGSTVSLGRNAARANTGYPHNGKLGEDELELIMSRTLSSPNLHETGTAALTTPTRSSHLRNRSDANTSPSIPSTDYAAIAKDLESSSKSLRQHRTGNPLTSGSSTSLASTTTPTSNTDPVFRGTPHGVPLSLFERRILGKPRSAGQNHGYSQSMDEQSSISVNPIKASPRFSFQNDGTRSSTPLSATFGEDTDYKRLSRDHLEGPATIGLFPNDTQDKPKTSMDAATTTSRNADMGDKTPKGRIISLYADDFNAANPIPGSRPASSRQSFDAPPPVPPKSPRFSSATSATSDSFAARQPPPMPNRAPMPAPTPAFAAVLAAEEAYKSGSVPPTPTTAKTTLTYGNGSSSDLNGLNNSSMPTSPVRSISGMPGASPALFAGLPSLNGSSASINRSGSQTRTFQQEQPQSQPQPQSQSQTVPIQYSGLPAGNPLFAGAVFNSARNGSANGKVNGHERNESTSSTSSNPDSRRAAATAAAANAMPREVIKTLKTNVGSSFLEDLESNDGFNRAENMQDSHDNPGMKSPKTPMSLGGTSSSVDYDEDDDEDYGGDWGPLQARQNVIPANPKSSSYNHQQSYNGSSQHYHETIEEEGDENWEENDTEGDFDEEEGEEEDTTSNAIPPSLALFGGINTQNAKKASSPGKYVVKRVTSRPSTAPAQIDGDESTNSSTDDSSQSSGGFVKVSPNSASARKIPISRLLRKPPQTAPSNAGRRLSSMVEEEEELEETTIDSAEISR